MKRNKKFLSFINYFLLVMMAVSIFPLNCQAREEDNIILKMEPYVSVSDNAYDKEGKLVDDRSDKATVYNGEIIFNFKVVELLKTLRKDIELNAKPLDYLDDDKMAIFNYNFILPSSLTWEDCSELQSKSHVFAQVKHHIDNNKLQLEMLFANKTWGEIFKEDEQETITLKARYRLTKEQWQKLANKYINSYGFLSFKSDWNYNIWHSQYSTDEVHLPLVKGLKNDYKYQELKEKHFSYAKTKKLAFTNTYDIDTYDGNASLYNEVIPDYFDVGYPGVKLISTIPTDTIKQMIDPLEKWIIKSANDLNRVSIGDLNVVLKMTYNFPTGVKLLPQITKYSSYNINHCVLDDDSNSFFVDSVTNDNNQLVVKVKLNTRNWFSGPLLFRPRSYSYALVKKKLLGIADKVNLKVTTAWFDKDSVHGTDYLAKGRMEADISGNVFYANNIIPFKCDIPKSDVKDIPFAMPYKATYQLKNGNKDRKLPDQLDYVNEDLMRNYDWVKKGQTYIVDEKTELDDDYFYVEDGLWRFNRQKDWMLENKTVKSVSNVNRDLCLNGEWEFISKYAAMINEAPHLSVKNKEIKQGEKLDLKTLIERADDKEDGPQLNDKVVIDQGKFDSSKPGKYIISFSLTDKKGATVRKQAVVTVKKVDLVPVLPTKPFLISLKGERHILGTKDPVIMQSSSKIDNFLYCLIDAKELAKENYTVISGSTIVNIKADYLNKLKLGKHQLTIVSKDGQVNADIMIVSSPTNINPISHISNNGNNSTIGKLNSSQNNNVQGKVISQTVKTADNISISLYSGLLSVMIFTIFILCQKKIKNHSNCK